MKLSFALLPSIYALDGATSHLGGCVWPDTGVLGNKMTFADDPYAKFTGKDKSGLDSPYAEGDEIMRSCPTHCVWNGSAFVNCQGYEDDMVFKCGYKDGKNNRNPGRHFVFVDAARSGKKNIAVFFRTSSLGTYRPTPERKMCAKPTVVVSDPDAVCGAKPMIPTKNDVERFQDYTRWTDDGMGVTCMPNARPVRKDNYEQLNLVCDRQKANQSFKWFHQGANGRLRPVGNKWIKSRFLCRFCHSCAKEEASGDEPEGSGGDSADNAEVSL